MEFILGFAAVNIGDGMYAIGFKQVGYILYLYDFVILQIHFYQFNLSLENSEEKGSEIQILTDNTVMAGGTITMK